MSIRLWPTAASLANVFALLGCVSGSGAGAPSPRTNIYGVRISNDPKGVYETAVNSMFQGLDKVFDRLTPR